MPKFITYQRPQPVNKAAWGGKNGRPGGNPYQPVRRQQLPPAPNGLPAGGIKLK